MASISQIEVNGTIYDILDHNAATNYLPLVGGILTGPLIINSTLAQGFNNSITGNNSSAFGRGLVVSGDNQMVVGQFNKSLQEGSLIVGNGTGGNDDERQNALEVLKDGSVNVNNNLTIKTSGKGLRLTDKNNEEYTAIGDNQTNLWIGAEQTQSYHHSGQTFISSGHNGTTGNATIKICVPNDANDGGSSYDVYHTGYKPSPAAIGAVSKTSDDTITGQLTHVGKLFIQKADNLDRDGTPPAANTWGNAEFRFTDKDNQRIGLVNVQQRTTGDISMWIAPRTVNSNNAEAGGGLTIISKKDGTTDYSVATPANFTDAIKAKGLSGGTAIATQGDNLNNYMTVGTYYCAATSIATTLLNKPTDLTGAFVMYVGYSIGTGYPYQEIIQYNTGNRFYRYSNSTTDTSKWYPWLTFMNGKFLSLSGGTLTGALNVDANLRFGAGAAKTQYYLNAKTNGRTGKILWAGGGVKTDGDGNGTVVGLSGGGLTLIGAGKYPDNRYALADLGDTTESLYLGADSSTYIESNANTIADRKTWQFQSSGNTKLPDNGFIYLKNTNMTVGTTASVSTNPICLQDSTDTYIAQLRMGTDANKNSFAALVARRGRIGTGDNLKQASFAIKCTSSGAAEYTLTSPANFRSAISAYPTTGGWVSGNVGVQNGESGYFVIDTDPINIKANNNGVSSGAKYPAFIIRDKNDLVISRFEGIINSDGTTGIAMYARNNYSSDNSTFTPHQLRLSVAKNGTKSVTLDPVPWRVALQPQLATYKNFTLANITSAAEYKSGWTPTISIVSDTWDLNDFSAYVIGGNMVQATWNLTYNGTTGTSAIPANGTAQLNLYNALAITYKKGSSTKTLHPFGDLIQPALNAAVTTSAGVPCFGELQKNNCVLSLYFPKGAVKNAKIYVRATFLNDRSIWPGQIAFDFAK